MNLSGEYMKLNDFEKKWVVPHKIKQSTPLEHIVPIILICVLRMWAGLQIPRYIYGNYPDDDVLYLKLANELLKGNWLGSYSSSTLNKSPGYAFFLTLPTFTGLSYSLLYELFLIGVVITSVYAFSPLLNTGKKKVLWTIAMLFNPIFFDISTACHIYRNALTPIIVLLVISSLCALYLRPDYVNRNIFCWAVCAGISIFFFRILREDSIWLIPFIGGAIFCTFYINLKKLIAKKNVLRFGILLLPIIIPEMGINCLKLMNYHYYGLYTITDFNDTAFADVMSDIISIQPEEEKKYIWVTRNTIEKLYDISPSFYELKPYIDDAYTGDRQIWGELGDDGEIEKDYIIWAMRDVLKASGLYTDASELNAYLQQIHTEIQEAFASGLLKKRAGISISSLAKPLSLDHANEWFSCAWESICFSINYGKCSIDKHYSFPPNDNIRLAEAITREPLILLPQTRFNVNGWGFAKKENDCLEILIGNPSLGLPQQKVIFQESTDIFRYFEALGIKYKNSSKARFSYDNSTDEDVPLHLYCYINGKLEEDLLLEEILNSGVNTELIQLWIDSSTINRDGDPTLSKFHIPSLFKYTLFVFQHTGTIFMIFSCMCYLLLLIRFISKKKSASRFYQAGILLIALGLCASYIALHAGVAFNYYEAWNRDSRHVYLGAGYIIQELFCLLAITSLFVTDNPENTNEAN